MLRSAKATIICLAGVLAAASGAKSQDIGPDVIRALEARVQSVRDRLAKKFEEAGDAGVEGRFTERLRGSYLFAPADSELPTVPLANSKDVSGLATGPLLRVKGSLDRGTGQLTVASYELAVAPPKEDVEEKEQPKQRARAANRRIARSINESIQPGAQSTADRSLEGSSQIAVRTRGNIKQVRESYRAAVEACAAASPACNPKEIDELVKEWLDIRSGAIQPIFNDAAQDKAIYERLDNYEPWRYEQVSKDAASVVALADPGASKARCSGVLISKDLVLTAAHCFSGDPAAGLPPRAPAELEVWFGFAQHRDKSFGPTIPRRLEAEPVAPPLARWPEIINKKFGPGLFDYAIVRLKKDADQPIAPNGAEPRCLKRKSPNRHDSIYVMGYPLGEHVRVHANARVYLPYRVLEEEMYQLRLDMHADLVGDPDIKKHLDEFDLSYQKGIPDPIMGDVRVLYDVRDELQPRLGVIADVYKGNSGGPVFDHGGEQCVVGILNGGMPDVGKRLNASWNQHERVLPIEAILSDLAKNPATAPLLSNGELVLK